MCSGRSARSRGKSGARCAARLRRAARAFPTAEQPQRRKQVFASALKRVNREIDRLQKLEVRTAHIEAAHKALAMHRAGKFVDRPAPGETAGEGMRAKVSPRR